MTLKTELRADEGYSPVVYKDTEGNLTFGIGHLITEQDPEHGLHVGAPVERERIEMAFTADVETAIANCRSLYPQFDTVPPAAQLIIANMMFNLGLNGVSKFKKMKAAVDSHDWSTAADEMVDSVWYTQVPNRARRLVARMRAIRDA
eukprot:CAMPEP_0181315810 /NCGR_PEP_ID=MMETSP1101-20121128/15569_1 /TAXON_ID=46948 /ORGANISM="Rhodomonas abbreviata, Strain Caron Lab Isolate" /LENGTH=146 /DNA_ID=CAMNT_0023423033 /DNA_START=146 /DNA_END=586 /DNA_ORIENTATION=-